MRGAVIHAPGDIRFENLEDPKILKPTDAIIRTAVTRVFIDPLTCVNAVLPGMRTLGRGSLLFVNGGSAVRPNPKVAGTSIAFAAESAYAQMLHTALTPENIHVAQLIVPGAISPDSATSAPRSWPSCCTACTPTVTASAATQSPCPTRRTASHDRPHPPPGPYRHCRRRRAAAGRDRLLRRLARRAGPHHLSLVVRPGLHTGFGEPDQIRQEDPDGHPRHHRRQKVEATLNDSPAARDLASLLPLTLDLEDFHGTEWIADPPRKLTTENAPEPQAPKTGDLTYYVPWGNLALFYKDGPSASSDLLVLGHIDADTDRLSGADRITIEAAS